MAEVISFPAGGYRYIKGAFQYSGGVAAEPGFAVERARFRRPVPLAEGFAAVEAHLQRLGRPPTAFAACELRSPAPFDDEGFIRFNRQYVGTLERWGLFKDDVNPVARTNVCPEVNPPAEVCLYAFSYTVPGEGGFVAAGSGEAREGQGTYRERAVRFGDRSTEGLREKAQWVLGEMERRMSALGFGWGDVTGTHLYTVFDIHPFLGEELARRGAMAHGLSWHFARPPLVDLDYEMDVRGVAREIVI